MGGGEVLGMMMENGSDRASAQTCFGRSSVRSRYLAL